METKRNNKNQLQQIGPSYIYIINKYSPPVCDDGKYHLQGSV